MACERVHVRAAASRRYSYFSQNTASWNSAGSDARSRDKATWYVVPVATLNDVRAPAPCASVRPCQQGQTERQTPAGQSAGQSIGREERRKQQTSCLKHVQSAY